jgi:formyl-CoA transferase
VAERLGLGYEELTQINPRLIYAVGTGYGPTGPYQHKGGQDRIGQAMSGLMSASGDPDDPPVALAPAIIDFLGGMLLAQGVLLALQARERTGKGQRVDVSLLNSGIAAGIEPCTQALNTGEVWGKRLRPLHDVYKTQDGYLHLIGGFVRGGRPLPLVCKAMEIEDLSQDPRFDSAEKLDQNARELKAILQEVFLQRPTAEWVKRMDEQDLICVPVYHYGEVFQDPQVQHNNLVMEVDHREAGKLRLLGPPVKLSDTPGWAHLPPPMLGQHTDEVLSHLGYRSEEINELRANGVVV